MQETPQAVNKFDLNSTAVADLVKLGGAQADVRKAGNTEFVVIPKDHQVVSLQDYTYNRYAERPHRKIGTISVLDSTSFIQYYQLFHDENSRVFADETQNKLLAVLDYHGTGDNAPRWGDHRLDLTLRHSEEWTTWSGNDGQKQSQMDFAEFVEDNGPDIIEPNAATMLEVARDLTAKTDCDFGSAVRLSNGSVQFKYSEQTKGTFGAGQVEVPERFTISIPVYVGTDRVSLTSRLRYRINAGKLTFWYDLLRADVIERNAFLAVREEIAKGIGNMIINGAPAAK